jgi:uncharacterized protein
VTRAPALLAIPARLLLTVWLALFAVAPAAAQQFPALSGRVVDAANILSAETETALTARLEALETQSQRQLVVATIPDLEGYDVADYGYRLGRAWGIGDKDRNDGVILLIAPNERRMRIEVGYGLEPVLTDALSAEIIRNEITPRFRDGDFDGGVTAGVEAIARQITLPPEEAQAIAASAAEQSDGAGAVPLILFWIFVAIVIFVIVIGNRGGGKRYNAKRRRGGGPVIIWGGGSPGWGSSSSSWGGGGGFGGGGFGGFSGGGGSFGGGGASGGW